jgi:hypothetical protein
VSRQARIAIRAAVALTVLCAVAGCGSSEPDRAPPALPQSLTAPERAAAGSGYEAIRTYCRRLGLHLAGRRPPPGAAAQRRALDGAREIAALARRKPEAPYSPDQTAGQLAADTAEDLEGTNCSAGLVAELARGL